METYYWKTDSPHWDNNETLQEYLGVHMDPEWKVISDEGTMAEVQLPSGQMFAVHARGNGDAYDHAIDFVEIETTS